jgi:hypothetical protein
VRGINAMKRNNVTKIEDPDEIIENLNNSPRRRKNTFTSMTSLNLTV